MHSSFWPRLILELDNQTFPRQRTPRTFAEERPADGAIEDHRILPRHLRKLRQSPKFTNYKKKIVLENSSQFFNFGKYIS